MCIRDSIVVGAFALVEILQLPLEISGMLAGQARQLVGTVPVSYTHLRAHETVLDLVCRLLLEKKKT